MYIYIYVNHNHSNCMPSHPIDAIIGTALLMASKHEQTTSLKTNVSHGMDVIFTLCQNQHRRVAAAIRRSSRSLQIEERSGTHELEQNRRMESVSQSTPHLPPSSQEDQLTWASLPERSKTFLVPDLLGSVGDALVSLLSLPRFHLQRKRPRKKKQMLLARTPHTRVTARVGGEHEGCGL